MACDLVIKYKGKINYDFDTDLIQLIRDYGYRMYAAGYNIKEDVRDICFDKEEEN